MVLPFQLFHLCNFVFDEGILVGCVSNEFILQQSSFCQYYT